MYKKHLRIAMHSSELFNFIMYICPNYEVTRWTCLKEYYIKFCHV